MCLLIHDILTHIVLIGHQYGELRLQKPFVCNYSFFCNFYESKIVIKTGTHWEEVKKKPMKIYQIIISMVKVNKRRFPLYYRKIKSQDWGGGCIGIFVGIRDYWLFAMPRFSRSPWWISVCVGGKSVWVQKEREMWNKELLGCQHSLWQNIHRGLN